jgi:hypothetical protein
VGRAGAQGKRPGPDRRPPSFPPPKEFPGWRVGCFLTPPSAERWAYPQELEVEIEEELGGKGQYIFDIPNFRQAGYDTTLDQVYKMTERRFQVGRRMIQNKPWDFFMLCDIAPDRLHHVFWQYVDPAHPLHEPGNKYEGIFQDYYRFLDRQLADFLELVPEDAVTIVMSDHGARPMMGGLCFNDWLIQEGFLALEEKPTGPMPIKEARIDWSRTRAWGDGGYYGRVFLNVEGREPGQIEPADYEATRDELIAKLEAAPGPDAGRRHEGAQASRRYPRSACARPDRLLRRPGVALGRLRRQHESLHLRERHRPRRREPRPRRCLHHEGPAGAADRQGRRHAARRRRPIDPRHLRHRLDRGATDRRWKELPVVSDQKGFTVWFTGLSGSGKSTIAEMLFHELQARGMKTEILDGDVVRRTSPGLGSQGGPRHQHHADWANLLTRNGVAAICRPISPYKETRDANRALIGEFVEVMCTRLSRRSPPTATRRASTRKPCG